MLDALHDLAIKFKVDIHRPPLHDLLNPTLPGKSLVSLRIGTDHLQQLLSSHQVVQHHYLLGKLRDVLFSIAHGGYFPLE